MQLSARQTRELCRRAPEIVVVVDTPEFKAGTLPAITDADYQDKSWIAADKAIAARLRVAPLRADTRAY